MKGLQNNSLYIREFFWDVKTENGFLEKYKKIRNKKWAQNLHNNCKRVFNKNIP